MGANARRIFYLVAGLIASIIPILVQLGVLSDTQAAGGHSLLEALSSLIGGAGALTAGAVLARQQKAGYPELLNKSPVDLVLDNVPVVIQQAQDAQANVDKMRQVAESVLGSLPTPFNPQRNKQSDPIQDILDSLGGQQ